MRTKAKAWTAVSERDREEFRFQRYGMKYEHIWLTSQIWTLEHEFWTTDSHDHASQIVDRPANVHDDDLDQPITPPQLASVPGVKQMARSRVVLS